MKTIKIFLASSIDEFKAERNELQCFINDIAEDFIDRYDINIRVLRCEKFDPHYTAESSQEKFNQAIKESEMCVFLFFKKAGEYTVEEFEVARKAFEESNGKNPKIYTYFKNVADGEAEQSVIDFMQMLDKNLKHFYQTFDNIDTVKLRLLLNLRLQEMDFISVEFENGKCLVDGKEALALDNVSEFANNKILNELKREFDKINSKYLEMKPVYAKGSNDDAFNSEYIEIATKRQSLVDQIEELEKNIFNMSLRMCEDENGNEITERQQKAYELFRLGDLDGAIAVLDSNDIDDEFERTERLLDEQKIKNAKRYVREHKTAIDILEAMVNNPNRFDEIEKRFQKIVPVVEKYNVEIDIIAIYSDYLNLQNKKEAGKYYEKAIAIFSATENKDIEEQRLRLSMVYNNAGNFYEHQYEHQKAKEYYQKAIEIREVLAKENPEKYNGNLATSYNNAGLLCEKQGELQKAEEFYKKAIEIREALAKENPEKYNDDLATSYNNAGILYDKQDEYQKAEKFHQKAIEIREALTKENLEKYSENLSRSYMNIGILYANQGKTEKADISFLKALEISEVLAKLNPERYNGLLAISYDFIGAAYSRKNDKTKALEYYLKAIEIFDELVEENPDRYNARLAQSCNCVGNLLENNQTAEKYYLKAIEICESTRKYDNLLAVSYCNYAFFKGDKALFEKAYELAKQNLSDSSCRRIVETFEKHQMDVKPNGKTKKSKGNKLIKKKKSRKRKGK